MNTKEFLNQDWVKQEIISRLNYNPETGSLTWAERDHNRFTPARAGKEVGYIFKKGNYTNNILHMEIRGRKVTVVVARLCWLVKTGDWPKHTVDHLDRDSLNNKWENLRDVTQNTNNQNKGRYNTKFFGGIAWDKGSYNLVIKGKYLGRSKCFGQIVKIRQEFVKESLDPSVEIQYQGHNEAKENHLCQT